MSYGTVQAEKMTTESGYSLGAGNASSFKNRVINGGMTIDQRNAGASVTPTANTYTLDRWLAVMGVTSKYSVQRNAGSVTPPAGFVNYLGITSTSAYSSGTNDPFLLNHYIEGFNVSDLGWGTASAKSITISFWVRSSLTGTFSLSVCNQAASRNYIATYTISSANTWEYETITIPGDTTGTWLTDSSIGVQIRFDLGSGSGYNGTAGSWGTSNLLRTSGSQSVVGTNGATFYITGVQFEVGTVATSFDFRSFGTELQLCKRYFETSYNYGTAVGAVTVDGNVLWLTSQQWGVTSVPNGPIIQGSVVCEVAKRAVATIVGYSTNTGASGKFVLGSTNLDVTYANWLQQAPSTRHIGYPQNVGGAGFGNTDSVRFQWTASAEL